MGSELTYTSNATEGNTLTPRETAEMIEHDITVAGKRRKERMEAVDHYLAVRLLRKMAPETTPISEAVISDLHRRIIARGEPGIYSPPPAADRRIADSVPEPAEGPE